MKTKPLVLFALAAMPLVSCATTAQKRALVWAGVAAASAAAWSLSGVVGDAVFPDRRADKSQQDTNNLFVVLYSSVTGAALGTGLAFSISNIQQWSKESRAWRTAGQEKPSGQKSLENGEDEKQRLAAAEQQRLAEQKRREEEEAEKRRLAAADEERLAEERRLAAAERWRRAAAGKERLPEQQRREDEEAEEQRLAEQQRESSAPAQRFVVRRAVPALFGRDTYLFWTGKKWSAYLENARLFESAKEALLSSGLEWNSEIETVNFEEAEKG